MITGKNMAVSALVVGTAAAVGFYLQSDRTRHRSGRSKANLGARVVETVPQDATVVDISSDRLSEIPGAKRVLEEAVRNRTREEWEHVTFDRDGAWAIVDSIRQSLPYYDGDSETYNGVYVHCNGYVVVLDAFGWARLETPTH